MRGGGDLFAYRWVAGVGGTRDVLASSNSFAVIPGYTSDYAPYAPYNPTVLNQNLGGDAGYVNRTLAVGDRIYLDGSSGLPPGNYTLLPARYALLPGAFLVTPQSGTPPGSTQALAGGASLVAGYRFNDLNAARAGAPLASAFEVAPQAVVRARAEYDDSLANTFLRDSATARQRDRARRRGAAAADRLWPARAGCDTYDGDPRLRLRAGADRRSRRTRR